MYFHNSEDMFKFINEVRERAPTYTENANEHKLWASVQKTPDERRANALLRRAHDWIAQKFPEAGVSFCWNSSSIWTKHDTAYPVVRCIRESVTLKWNEAMLAQTGIQITEEERREIATLPAGN